MKRVLVLLTAVLGLSLGLAPSPVAAATVSDCQALITNLQTETQAATFTGQNADQDRAGLLGKLSDAQTKLSEGKFLDAAGKLTDYRDKVVSLSAEGKLDPTQAITLEAGADDAIACVLSLIT
jgi:hypothetical protein